MPPKSTETQPTTDEQNPGTAATETAAEDTQQDTEQPLEINGKTFTLIGTTRGKKNKQLLYLLKQESPLKDFCLKVASAVGEENFWKCAAAMIRTSCKDSTQQAISTAEDGVPTEDGFIKALVEWYTDETRRSGVHIKDIKERMSVVVSELSPLMSRAFDPKAEPLTPEDHSKMVQLSVELSDLNAKIEKVSAARKGKKKTAAAAK